MAITTSSVQLQDLRLFRQACYIDGTWIDSSPHGAIDVDKLVSVVAGAGWEVLGVEPTDDALEEAFRAAVLGAGSPATGAEES